MKVLYVSHNHPVVRPGGAEAYALELYEGMRDEDGVEALFVARSGPPVSTVERYHEGTLFTSVGDDPGQYFLHTDIEHYDWLYGRSPDKVVLTTHFRDFLHAHRPDVVHFQHSLFLGYDILRVTRNALPDAAIVYTLHEFLPICHNSGQMMRTGSGAPCTEASPRRCHECFPQIAPQEFFMRERFIKSHFALVDTFIAPSRQLREKYVAWGIEEDRIVLEEYGRLPVAPADPPPRAGGARRHTRFGFFGQLSHFKGVNVVLRALDVIGDGFDGHVWIHGTNLDVQAPEFQEEFKRLLDRVSGVTYAGAYQPREVGGLMSEVDWVIVPSVWWENSPLVIQEAFAHGRPVICSDFGGMAEKVTDGVDGLHFRRGDHHALAATLQTAASSRPLWDKLHRGIRPVHPMSAHIETLRDLYERLLATRAGAIQANEMALAVEVGISA